MSSASGAVWLSLTLTDSWLEILRGIGSLITHNRNYRRTRQTHKALKQDERFPPLLPLGAHQPNSTKAQGGARELRA